MMFLFIRLQSLDKIDLQLIRLQFDNFKFNLHVCIELNKIFRWRETLISHNDFLTLYHSLKEAMTPHSRKKLYANNKWSYKGLTLDELHEFTNAWLIGDFSYFLDLSNRIQQKFGSYLRKSIEIMPKEVVYSPRAMYVWKNNENVNPHFNNLIQRLQANQTLRKFIKANLYLDDLGDLLKHANDKTKKDYQSVLHRKNKRQKTLPQYLNEKSKDLPL